MDATKEFHILLRRKIPYVSEGLWLIIFALLLILGVFYLFMLPTKNASDEMATAYYILIIPEWLKNLSAIALLGLLITSPLYFAARLKKPAVLTLADTYVFITGKHLKLRIAFKDIKRVYFNDLMYFSRRPKNKMQIVIQLHSNKTTVFLLANYGDADLALENFSKIKNAEFAFYEDNMITMHQDDE